MEGFSSNESSDKNNVSRTDVSDLSKNLVNMGKNNRSWFQRHFKEEISHYNTYTRSEKMLMHLRLILNRRRWNQRRSEMVGKRHINFIYYLIINKGALA